MGEALAAPPLQAPPKARRGKISASAAAVAAAVAEINRHHALVLVGDKALILRETEGESGALEIGFQSPAAFRLWHCNRKLMLDGDAVGLGDVWLEHPERRSYHGITFAPSTWERDEGGRLREVANAPDLWFNLWRGWSVEPARPYADTEDHRAHFPTFDGHLLDNVCGGDRALQRWVYGWFAHMFQRPLERLGTALVLRGRQGTGKTTVGEVFGRCLGPHYVLVDSPRYILGQFNAHMVSCLLLQADEGFWAGDKQAEGKLKGLVTSKMHMIERKGVDPVPVRNLVRLMVSSNNDWVVPAGMEERRFAVLDVGDQVMQDAAYFRALWGELDEGGLAHLLTYALTFDLDSVDLRRIPQTEALWEQKVATLDPLQSWWFERLMAGTVLAAHRGWKDWVPADGFYSAYCAFADRLGVGRKKTQAQIGIELHKLLPPSFERAKSWVSEYDEHGMEKHDVHGSVMRRRVWGYRLPPLEECRDHFAALVRHAIDWGQDEAQE